MLRRPLALLIAFAVAVSVGCVTTPLDRRHWVEVETPHFVVTSSLDREDTLRLVQDLERYRTAVGFLLGPGAAALEGSGGRVRVYAFDGRGFERPFAIRGGSDLFLPDPDAAIIVLREGGGWRGDATHAMRHDLAHAFFRRAYGVERPLWYDEGFAQLAATTELKDGSETIGRLPRSARAQLKDHMWRSTSRAFPISELSARTSSERAAFEAEAGASVQLLLLEDGGSPAARAAPERYFDAIEKGGSAQRAFESAFGVTQSDLIERLRDGVRAGQLPAVVIRTDATKRPPKAGLRPLDRDEVWTQLGWLGVELGRSEPAATYFSRVIARSPDHARAQSGLGAVAALEGEWDRARERHDRAVALARDDPMVLSEAAADALALAVQTRDPTLRAESSDRSRALYARSLEVDDARAASWLGLARAALLADGSHPDASRVEQAAEAVRRACALAPGALEVELVDAEVARARGHLGRSRQLASTVAGRTHDEAQLKRACVLLDAINRCGAPSAGGPGSRRGAGEAEQDLCGLVRPEDRETCH